MFGKGVKNAAAICEYVNQSDYDLKNQKCFDWPTAFIMNHFPPSSAFSTIKCTNTSAIGCRSSSVFLITQHWPTAVVTALYVYCMVIALTDDDANNDIKPCPCYSGPILVSSNPITRVLTY